MGIYKYLDCSTSHITHEDSLILKKFAERDIEISEGVKQSLPPIHVVYYPEGFVIFVPDSDIRGNVDQVLEECKQEGLSNSFAQIIKLAASECCLRVFIDCDGDLHEGLTEHNW